MAECSKCNISSHPDGNTLFPGVDKCGCNQLWFYPPMFNKVYPPEPVAPGGGSPGSSNCGTDTTYGTVSNSNRHFLGGEDGMVHITCDPGRIEKELEDGTIEIEKGEAKFQVYYDGAIVAESNGYIDEGQVLNFYYTPKGADYEITMKVSTDCYDVTWFYTVGCPGGGVA